MKNHLIPFAAIGLYLTLAAVTGITCPILYFFKFPCPTCGVTRAMLALLRFDWVAYCSYNFMAVLLVSAVGLLIHAKRFKKPKWIYGYCFAVLFLNSMVYLFRVLL